jgi:hypothetical protein
MVTWFHDTASTTKVTQRKMGSVDEERIWNEAIVLGLSWKNLEKLRKTLSMALAGTGFERLPYTKTKTPNVTEYALSANVKRRRILR